MIVRIKERQRRGRHTGVTLDCRLGEGRVRQPEVEAEPPMPRIRPVYSISPRTRSSPLSIHISVARSRRCRQREGDRRRSPFSFANADAKSPMASSRSWLTPPRRGWISGVPATASGSKRG